MKITPKEVLTTKRMRMHEFVYTILIKIAIAINERTLNKTGNEQDLIAKSFR